MSFYEDEEAQRREAILLHSDDDDINNESSHNNQTSSPPHAPGSRKAHSNATSASASNEDPSGYYKALALDRRATQQDIRKAFLYMSQRYHTDKHSGQIEAMQDAMNTRFQELQEAYTVLSDEKQRAAYDAAGKKGAERLALVPAHYTSRKDIIGYIHSLDREAQLVKTAKMLSATSNIAVNYSTAALFLTPAAKAQVLAAASGGGPELPRTMTGTEEEAKQHEEAAGEEGTQQGSKESGSGNGVTARKSSSNSLGATTAADAATNNNAGGREAATATAQSTMATGDEGAAPRKGLFGFRSRAAAPTTPTPTSASKEEEETAKPREGPNATSAAQQGDGQTAVQAQMVAKEVVVDGQKQIVLIPSAEMQAQIREKMQVAQAGAGAAVTDASSSDSSSSSSWGFGGNRVVMGRTVSLLTAVAVSSVPTSMVLRHSFQHAVSPRLGLLFRTYARSEGGRAQVAVTSSAEFQQDAYNAYALILRTTIGGLKLTVVKEKILSPIWTLRSKLTCLNGGQLLQKLELCLTRKLSADTELANTVAWSLNERGFFSSRIAQAWERGSQGLNMYLSYHGMTLTAFTATSVTYGTETHDPKHPPSRGRVQYSINCSPFSGQTQAGFEAWYYHAPLQHYGIAFMTVLPYSISPVAPPLFFVESSQYAVVNQVSFLYARGQHRISVPVIVFISPQVSQGLLWLSVPLLCYRIARVMYTPYAKVKAAKYYAALRREHLAEMDIIRERAVLEQRALELIVMQSRASEDRKGGLVIVNAQYGVLSPVFTEDGTTPVASPTTQQVRRKFHRGNTFFARLLHRTGAFLGRAFSKDTKASRPSSPGLAAGGGSGMQRNANGTANSNNNEDNVDYDDGADALDVPLTIDVTIALQNLVRDSALVLAGGSKSELTGFCDPDPFTPERKQLKITYWFRKKKHCVIVDDDEPVELPQREHLVQ